MRPSILITGAGGQVAEALSSMDSTIDRINLSRQDLDITDTSAVKTKLNNIEPMLVINAAAYTAVDKAESEAEVAFAVNEMGCKNLAQACAELEIPLFHVSTDYVYDGTKGSPYVESDEPMPRSVYGLSKLAGERALEQACPRHIILRTSWLFSETGNNFVKTMLRLASERTELNIVSDQRGCPTSANSIAGALLLLAEQYVNEGSLPWGTYHFSNRPGTTWFDFAKEVFHQAGLDDRITINPIPTTEYPTPATRPENSILDCSKFFKNFPYIEQADWRKELTVVLDRLVVTALH